MALSCALFVACGVVIAACGGASGPGVASDGSSSTTTTSPGAETSNTANAANYLDAVKYSNCMRTHGVSNFPDPNSQGDFLTDHGVTNGEKVDFNSSQYISANRVCEHLLPNGGQSTPAELQAALAQALKFVQCLRTHGIPNMADPTIIGGNIRLSFAGSGLRPNSPRLRASLKACQSFAPFGP